MEANVLYKVEPLGIRGNTGKKCGLLLGGNTVDITIYGSKTVPNNPTGMVDLTNGEPYDAEGAYVLSMLPPFVYFYGTADVIELVGYVAVENNFTGLVPMTETDLSDLNYSSEEIDDRLIYLASIDTTGQIIKIYGNMPRTSASDAAFAELTTTLGNFIIEDTP